MKNKKSGKKVFVGLSGGVDSSVAAALLKRGGYEVTGVFIKAWYPFDSAQDKPVGGCDWREDRRDAMRVCARLDIPFLTLDLEKEYKKKVVDYMLREYRAGRTPNPDVMCNKEIKFGHFLKYALKQGADYIATGHYAQSVERKTQNVKLEFKANQDNEMNALRFTLYASRDRNKDQSYFLWTLRQEQLKHVLFPVGHLKKSNVRKLAKKFSLPTAEKKDSQGLCFIGKIDMKDFLSRYIKAKRGNVVDVNGKRIGYHDGAQFLTIGQRHGFTVTKKGSDFVPMYVVSKDIKKNIITLSKQHPDKLALPVRSFERPRAAIAGSSGGARRENVGVSEIVLDEPNWINDTPVSGKTYKARLRYRQKLMQVLVRRVKGKWTVNFKKRVMDASSGQSLVIYDRNAVIGGGVIV